MFSREIAMKPTIDVRSGTIFVNNVGFLSKTHADRHMAEFAAVVASFRRTRLAVRVMVDMTAGSLQSAPVAELLRTRTAAIFLQGDRVALVVASALLVIQLRRTHGAPVFGIFAAANEAALWLSNGRGDDEELAVASLTPSR